MATLNRHTGGIVTGFDEVLQGLEILFTTRKNTRVMRRYFGAGTPELVDRPVSSLTLIEFYAEIAEGLQTEKRFALVNLGLASDSDIPNGKPIFDISGIWYPKGHLGDFSDARDVTGRLNLSVLKRVA